MEQQQFLKDLTDFARYMAQIDPDGVNGNIGKIISSNPNISEIINLEYKAALLEEKKPEERKWAWFSMQMYQRYWTDTHPRYLLKDGRIVEVTIINSGENPTDPYEGRVPDVVFLGEIEKLVSRGSSQRIVNQLHVPQ